ncbi:hypothetical protein H632_c642p1 [Helicosporidium sp. ATCC 50920]|nr:hypothetical protein H632_c642p1 [Helicosporidium sp. ATCC 50920]|eukprot:KDD75517.1 hypothetical protein H632_c642p1 [Helicosporidium sp. ATCC 50920]
MQRQRQVDFGKNTLGYQRYIATVPKSLRRRGTHPSTPDAHQSCSKRSFDGQIRKWRRQLHDWDPPAAEEEGTAAEQLPRPREAQNKHAGLEAGPVGRGRDASVVEAHHPRSHSPALSPSASYEFVDRVEAQEGSKTDPPASALPAAAWPKKESELRSLNALLPRLVQALDRKRSTPEVSAPDAQLQPQSRMHKTARTAPSDADVEVDYR